jgi:hypothetical protein
MGTLHKPSRLQAPTFVVFAGALITLTALQAAAQVDDPERTGPELYAAACAACHGSDGRGVAQSTAGFDTPLPDFTECTFATREPDEDWLAVIHDGGPVRAFDRMMPAFGEALSVDEMGRILGHVRGFCQDGRWPRGELNLPRPLVTEKAYPEDEAVLEVSAAAEGSGFWTQQLVYERRFGARNQIEIVVPFAIQQGGSGSWSGGVGDVALALKRVLAHSLESGSILSVAGEVILPTGNRDRGFGSGATVFEPFVALGQILPASGFAHFQGGFEIPADRNRPDTAFWRTAVGRTWVQDRFGRAWSPMVELLGARDLGSDGSTRWDLAPQLQVSLSTRQHVLLSGGVRVPMNDAGSRNTEIMLYLLWDWFDGGLFTGW